MAEMLARGAHDLRLVGLTPQEYEQIVEMLGRAPNDVELGMFGAMWSEHCGYKHSKTLLRTLPTSGPAVVQGPGENAGAVSLGDGLLLVLKIESHNHPSAIEPYQGAATGVGGILRDIFAMGARPIALMDSLRFGILPLDPDDATGSPRIDDRTRYLLHGVVAGVGGYGNCMGVPTVGGETVFEPSYLGNPLVNVLCLGLAEEGTLLRAQGGAPGNLLVLFGAATGRDGIHGASFSSVELDEQSEQRRPAVQVGDPLTEKLLMEACLDLRDRGLLAGLQDLGAAGLTSSTVELADKTGSGVLINLDLVPRRAPAMTAYELMLSESQERMIAAVEPGQLGAVQAVLDHWELPHAVIGEVTEDTLVRITAEGRTVVEVPVSLFTDACPIYTLNATEDPATQLARETEPPRNWSGDCSAMLLRLLAHPNIGSKRSVWRQYDHMVGTNTVLAPGADAAVLRLKGRKSGVGFSLDGNGRLCALDPYCGGVATVLEAARNVACVGGRALCATDGLNFGNPEKPEVAYQLQQVVAGMGDACRALGIPIVSGNVSLYNESPSGAIYPTPIVGVAGLIEDVSAVCTAGFKAEGDRIYLAGSDHVSLGGSLFTWLTAGVLVGTPATPDMDLEARLHAFLHQTIAARIVQSAHDCSDGGLAVTLAECAINGNLGATIRSTSAGTDPALSLFGEGQGRVVLTVSPAHASAVEEHARHAGIPLQDIGIVGGENLSCEGVFTLELQEICTAWEQALDPLMQP